MKMLFALLIATITASTGCRGTSTSVSETAAASQISQGALEFMDVVAAGVSRDGPIAWKRYLGTDPAFYMVSEGRLVFDGGEVARRSIDDLTRTIERIELRWGEPIRVDPQSSTRVLISAAYFERIVTRSGVTTNEQGWMTGLAERRPEGWSFLNLHWSVVPDQSSRRGEGVAR